MTLIIYALTADVYMGFKIDLCTLDVSFTFELAVPYFQERLDPFIKLSEL